MEKNSGNKGLPNWILFLLGGALGWGMLYGIYMHGFLKYDPEIALLNEMGTLIAKAEVQIPPRSPQSIAAGESSYKIACGACHGQKREGLVGPSLADAQWLHSDQEAELASLIISGIPADKARAPGKIAMPPKGGASISTAQVWEIVYFLSSVNGSIQKAAE